MKINGRAILITSLLLIISFLSLPGVKNFYYWKDDWVFMWSNKYSPSSIYGEFGTSGTGWQVKTGLLMLPYARLYGQIPYQTLQLSGMVLKFLNSCVVLLVVYSLTKNKSTGVLSGLLYAAYSGGVDVYTWHRITAMAVGFSALAFAFHNLYIDSRRPVYLVGICVSATLAMFSFFGRAIGLFPLLALSTFLHLYLQPKKHVFGYLAFLVIIIFGLVILTRGTAANLASSSYSKVLSNSIANVHILYSNIGNLVRIPFFVLPEEGGLVGNVSRLSLNLGKIFFVAVGVSLIVFLARRSRNFLNITSILFWMALLFIPNWMYAGGGPTVMVGSAHRYMAGIGMGVIMMIGLGMAKMSRLKQIVVFVFFLIAFFKYSTYVINIESSQRNADLVMPIYQKIMEDTKNDPLPRALIVHTTRNNLVTGWLPYAYAYFKGLSNYNQFPTVFSNSDAAVEWACAPDDMKEFIANRAGAPDYQRGRPVLAANIYAWSIDSNGRINDDTTNFRERVSKCQQKK